MALFLLRSTVALRTKGIQLVCTQLESKLGVNATFSATLTSYHGEPAKRKKPWPYKTKDFRFWHLPFDRVDSRLDDNSKIIVIDGNIATGKTELGKRLAEEFDMLYVPDVTDAEMYTMGSMKVDIREFDEQLPTKAKSCDFEMFYSQSGSKAVLANFARTQYELFRCKVFNYAQNVIAHVLNTGKIKLCKVIGRNSETNDQF